MSVSDVQYGTPACSLPHLSIKQVSQKDAVDTAKDTDEASSPPTFDQFPVWLVAFRRLVKGSYADAAFVNNVNSRNLLHSVTGLYSVTLPNMDNDTLYASVLDKQAVTMLVFEQREEALINLLHRLNLKEEKRLKRQAKSKGSENDNGENESDEEIDINKLLESGRFDVAEGEKDVYTSESVGESDFACVFTDSESEEEEEEEDDDEEDGEAETDEEEEAKYSSGYNQYVKSCLQRKLAQRDNIERLDVDNLGVENFLIAGATFETKFVDHAKILHLTLLVVRKRFRRRGLGSQLIRMIKDTSITGDYQAVVVHADPDAMDFFRRHGFTEDYVLNRRWQELADEYTDCTLMTYMAGFSRAVPAADTPGAAAFSLDLVAMEGEMEGWRKKEEEAHTQQVQLFYQMRQEILHLRASLSSQGDIVKYLMKELRKSASEKSALENEILTTKYDRLKATLGSSRGGGATDRALETNATNPVSGETSVTMGDEEFALLEQIRENFESAVNSDPRCSGCKYRVTKVVPALVSQAVRKEFNRQKNSRASFKKKGSVQLYYCGSQEKPSRINEVLSQSFSDHDMKQSSFGKALYFAPNPTTAAIFSVSGRLILAEVLLGKVSSSDNKDRKETPQRTGPPDGYDSLLVAGRSKLTPLGGGDVAGAATLEQEYVVYSPGQAIPVALIEYTVDQ